MAFIFVRKFKKINKEFFRFLKTFGCYFHSKQKFTEQKYLIYPWDGHKTTASLQDLLLLLLLLLCTNETGIIQHNLNRKFGLPCQMAWSADVCFSWSLFALLKGHLSQRPTERRAAWWRGTHPRWCGPRPRIYANICRTRANTRAVYLLISRQVLIIQIPKNIFSQMLQARIGNEFFKILVTFFNWSLLVIYIDSVIPRLD